MTGILDYGVGNLFSLKSSFAAIGEETVVSADPGALAEADRLVLPGVGAFGDAADKLRAAGLDRFLLSEASRGKPILGICLGMQLLFERSLEYGEHRGLGLLEGTDKNRNSSASRNRKCVLSKNGKVSYPCDYEHRYSY